MDSLFILFWRNLRPLTKCLKRIWTNCRRELQLSRPNGDERANYRFQHRRQRDSLVEPCPLSSHTFLRHEKMNVYDISWDANCKLYLFSESFTHRAIYITVLCFTSCHMSYLKHFHLIFEILKNSIVRESPSFTRFIAVEINT